MPTHKINVQSLEVTPVNGGELQVAIDIVSFEDEAQLIIIFEDEVVTDRAEVYGWIDSSNRDAVERAARDLGLL